MKNPIITIFFGFIVLIISMGMLIPLGFLFIHFIPIILAFLVLSAPFVLGGMGLVYLSSTPEAIARISPIKWNEKKVSLLKTFERLFASYKSVLSKIGSYQIDRLLKS